MKLTWSSELNVKFVPRAATVATSVGMVVDVDSLALVS